MTEQRDELESFRKEWITELRHKRTGDEKKEEGISLKQPENLEKTSVRMDDQNKPDCKNPEMKPEISDRKKNRHEYEAFTIANKYLNITGQSSCRYCNKHEKSPQYSTESCRHSKVKSDNVFSGKRKRTNSDEKDRDVKRRESLVDQLISDIDEITSIPFFDLELPKEIAINIFTYLSVQDLSQCCLVNKQWKALAEDDAIWFAVYESLNLNKNALELGYREGWKVFVREKVLEKKFIQQKWKERFCEVRDLENEKGTFVYFCLWLVGFSTRMAIQLY